MAIGARQRHRNETGSRPFWRRHLFKLTLLPLGLAVAIWFLVIQPRTSKTVNEAFPTALPGTAVAVATATTVASIAVPALTAISTPTATLTPTPAAANATAVPTATTPPTVVAASTTAPTVPPTSAPLPTSAPTGPVAVKSGLFARVLADGSGKATLFRLTDGTYLLRLEDLSVTNGPDLRVRLLGPNGASLDLGGLKGNKGNQNYELPADFDPARYDAVDIWCRTFREQFIKAPFS
jgi:hypothetical protein